MGVEYVTGKEFERFLNNDFAHLTADVKHVEGKLDKLAWKVAYAAGISSITLPLLLTILALILKG